jgi:hypothetical protein
MRRVFIVVVLIVAAAILGLWRTHGGIRNGLRSSVGMTEDNGQAEARDEIRKSFQLKPGDHVEVMGINGAVTIETSETKTAEVYVLRTAGSSDSLARREVVVEQTPTGFYVRGREARHLGLWDHLFGRNPKEEVTIKAPRQIDLSIRGVNGPITTGDIAGSIEAKGINGRVQLGEASRSAEISGINGNITLSLKQLGDAGARFNGINGNIELRLGAAVSADLSAKGMNGNVRSEIPAVAVEKEQYGQYSARIGNGGAPITINGINGNVRLTRSEAEISNAGATEKKSASQR